MEPEQHRFIVTGMDADGDRHTFETDDAARAEAMLCQFAEDLEVVRMSDTEGAPGAADRNDHRPADVIGGLIRASRLIALVPEALEL